MANTTILFSFARQLLSCVQLDGGGEPGQQLFSDEGDQKENEQ
jgi:hypothetical protein